MSSIGPRNCKIDVVYNLYYIVWKTCYSYDRHYNIVRRRDVYSVIQFRWNYYLICVIVVVAVVALAADAFDGGCGGGGDGGGSDVHHAVCNTMLSVPHALSSVKISVKYAGSALMRNILVDMVRTMPRHRSQNASRLSSTRNGFNGYDISLPMYEYARYRHVSTTA